jgi:hypothetical protein
MAKECEKKKSWAIKLLKNTQVNYEKQPKKSQKHIECEVGDLVWLNIKDFKMPKTLVNKFVLIYVGPYKIIRKPHFDVYILQLPMTLVAHLTFHMSKLKPIHENKKGKDQKQAYHPRFDIIEHKPRRETECILAAR